MLKSPMIVRGEGCHIEDAEGRRHLDASANAGVVAIGHGRTEIARALAGAGERVTFVYNASFTHPWQEELARSILDLAPPPWPGSISCRADRKPTSRPGSWRGNTTWNAGGQRSSRRSPGGRDSMASPSARCPFRAGRLGGGYAPLAAMVVSDKVRSVFAAGSGRFVHDLTYSGMPLSRFVGLKILEIMRRENLFDRARTAGALPMAGLRGLAERHAAIGEVRGRGLLIGVEFVADRKTRAPFPESANVTARIVKAMRARGVLVAAEVALSNLGQHGDHLQISPPYIVSDAEIARIVDALDEVLAGL
jgi:adenosylmethionine-8-amino-7-oxononanoate aminotransferase